VVLEDRVLNGASVVIDGNRIAAIEPAARPVVVDGAFLDVRGTYVVPGFIDVHVHGVEGFDTLDPGDPIAEIAARLPRYGVTSFCPTTVACGPVDLQRVLNAVSSSRAVHAPHGARVLPAHLESNFISPDYRGAQPASCLRLPPAAGPAAPLASSAGVDGDFSADDILSVIGGARAAVGIITLAPELPGGLELARALAGSGHRISIGHSGASFEEANAAFDAGARHATHLFNRMPPVTHRAPGLVGAVLTRSDVAAELICDGYHVHPAMCRVAIAAKGPHKTIAITDGTSGSGLARGAEARLGGRRIRVTELAATLDDGTLAGSTLTMDRAFRAIVSSFGVSIVDAALMCSTTPARELGLSGFGVLERDAVADVVVLDRELRVVSTFVNGRQVHPAPATVT
jgi:N-acetylglucosamine-6-phosphate deacetylase